MTALNILLIVAGVGYILARRVMGGLLEVKTLVVVPAVLTGVGISQLHSMRPVNVTTVGFVVAGVVAGVLLGAWRGTTVHLGDRNGVLWMRYRASSVGLWVLNFVVKGALFALEAAVSMHDASATEHGLLLSFGLGMFAESAVVALRAMHTRSTVVWAKGDDGAPHTTSPAFERARQWVTQDLVDLRKNDGGRLRFPDRDW